MAAVSGGEYRPLYMKEDSELTVVEDFRIDVVPVSNQQFYQFTQTHPRWGKSRISRLFAERNYLAQWEVAADNHWQPKTQQTHYGVVNVSWFAADAYCRAQNKRLPTTAEWEYIARASEERADGSSEPHYNQRILEWYAKPNLPAPIGQGSSNFWGIKDLHGLNWEWVQDFNSTMTSGESRADSSINTDLYCAAAASGSTDPSDYAAFMRYGFRSSLKAQFTLGNLGFRCAQDMP
tara:strand:- start:570 stop:1274 length:705 start_codon:yes stop_codon:yes gene_type:complete